jgi:glycosyltransferase involved in cell wall biosynthesis
MIDSPLISVVVPTYNRAHLLGQTIQSVLAQTYTHWELIIVDDGSDDDTESLLEAFHEARIKYFRLDHTGILGKVRNYGIQRCSGQFVAFLDSDDLWRPDKLHLQLSLFQQYPKAIFTFSNADRFGPGSINPPDHPCLFVGNVFRSVLFEEKFCIYMPSLVFKKIALEKTGLMQEGWKGGGDVDFFFRLAYHFNGIFTNERLIRIRSHEHSTSRRLGDLSYYELMEMYIAFYKQQWLSKKELKFLLGRIHYKMGLAFYSRRKKMESFKSFVKYFTLAPLHWKGWVRMLQVFLPGRLFSKSTGSPN